MVGTIPVLSHDNFRHRELCQRLSKIVAVAQMRQENVVFMLKTGLLGAGMGLACKIASRRCCLLDGVMKMLSVVVITIPAYNLEITRTSNADSAADAIDSAFDEVALQWLARNPGNTIATAKEKCDVELSIKIKPIK